MQIRTIHQNDQSQWLALWQAYQVFYQAEIPTETTSMTWERLLDPRETMYALVLEENGRLVGLVHYLWHRSTWTTGNYCYLQDLFVTPEQRNKGAGKLLIEAVYAKAAEQQCSRVYWLTQEHNHPARALYDQVAQYSGFIQYRKNLA